MNLIELLSPLALSLLLAAITTLILVLIGIPLAYGMAHHHSPWKPLLETILNTPLVLPPSVLGFYMLVLLSPEAPLGAFLEKSFGLRLVFSFSGLVLGSVIFSLPFMVQPLQAGFQNLPPSLREAAYTLGKSPLATLWQVLLPNIRPALLTGLVLSFAHTLGEFGVVLMLGGSIPGRTKVASIALYEAVESLNYGMAHFYAFTLLLLSAGMLLILYTFNRRSPQ